MKFLQRLRKDIRCHRRGIADSQNFCASFILYALHSQIRAGEHFACLLVEALARFSQCNGILPTNEERHPKLFLQVFDLPAECWLREI